MESFFAVDEILTSSSSAGSSLDDGESLSFLISAIDDDTDLESEIREDLRKDCREREVHEKIEGFVETTIQNYTEKQFRKHFRLKRKTVKFLIGEYQKSEIYQRQENIRGKILTSADKCIYITLWFLGNNDTYRELMDRFDLSISTAYIIIERVTKWLASESPKYIKWPDGLEKNRIAERFEEISGFEDVCGLIDCSHINIRTPIENKVDYYNRNKYFSIILQGVVDDRNRFIDIFVGEPGSLHDYNVLTRSTLFSKATQSPNFFGKFYLLGDSAYPPSSWMVSPFKDYGNLTSLEKLFNYYLAQNRIGVEHSFGFLKGKWRKLFRFCNLKIPFIIHCVVSACVLHNIYINFDKLADAYSDEDESDDDASDSDDDSDVSHDEPDDIIFDEDEEFLVAENDRRERIFHQVLSKHGN